MVLDGKTFGFKTQVIQKTDLLAVKLENSESTYELQTVHATDKMALI